MRQPIRYISALCLLGSLELGLIACSEKSVDRAAAATPAPLASPTPTAGPALSDAPAAAGFAVTAPLIVEHQLDVLAQRDGIIASIQADVGTRVHSGDLLAQLDSRQLSADREAARARTRSLQADLENWKSEAKVLESDLQRARKMWESELITQEQFEHAKFKAEADQWDVKRVEQLLVNAQETERSLDLEMEKARILAPFSGIVARRYIREAQQVAKGDRLFWVSAEGPLQMRFTLPERLVGQIRKGQPLDLSTADLPGQHFKMRVTELSPVIDPASGTFDVVAQVEGAPGALRPGMEGTVRIDNLQ